MKKVQDNPIEMAETEQPLFSEFDRFCMEAALTEAVKAAEEDEVPVGAVIACGGQIISRTHNEKERRKDPTAHAELLAIQDAAFRLKRWQLTDCTLYVTLEPCCMCAAAMIHARLERLVFAAFDSKTGAAGSFTDLFSLPHNHHFCIQGGLCGAESSALLKNFFHERRGAAHRSTPPGNSIESGRVSGRP